MLSLFVVQNLYFFTELKLALQRTLGALLEQVVSCSQLVDSRRNRKIVPIGIREELKEHMHAVLGNITKGMIPSAYFKAIIKLMGHADRDVRKKVSVVFICMLILVTQFK